LTAKVKKSIANRYEQYRYYLLFTEYMVGVNQSENIGGFA